MNELNDKEKEVLKYLLLNELKRVQHYSVTKSRMIIKIATKAGLDSVLNEMYILYEEFYNNKYESYD